MTSNESKQIANLIWSTLFSIQGTNMTNEDQLKAIETVIIKIAEEQRSVGRTQILNYFNKEIENLRGESRKCQSILKH